MTHFHSLFHLCLLVCVSPCAILCLTGCGAFSNFAGQPSAQPLGVYVDAPFQLQEENAEASKFVIYQHEFEENRWDGHQHIGGWRLNEYGEDHLKQIAYSLRHGAPYPVVVERSQMSVKPKTQFHYPVHFDPALDLQRRELVVRVLYEMGISDADQRVVVAPAFAEGMSSPEAEAAYARGIAESRNFGFGGFGFGGFGGGFGGF